MFRRFLWILLVLPMVALAQAPKAGVVVMHGKGGSPSMFVSGLASNLEGKGFAVENIEMAWSGKRDYDVSTAQADDEITAAIARLRQKGATKVFVAGHSQGGAYALHYGNGHACDGVVAIAPGGTVGGDVGAERFGESLKKAKDQVDQGKGAEKGRFMDHEGKRGLFPIATTAEHYLDWFSPGGAMDIGRSASRMNPAIPVLWISPTGDYPGLVRSAEAMYGRLPGNPGNRFYRPNSDHFGAPSASVDEIVRWIGEVMVKPGN